MGKHKHKHKRSLMTKITKHPLITSGLIYAIVPGAFALGCYVTDVRRDKEMDLMIKDFEHQNKEDVHNVEIERDSWKEKYFLLIRDEKDDKPKEE